MSAYHSCAIAESDRQYFEFCIDGRHYQCSALPFGWDASPYIALQCAGAPAEESTRRSPLGLGSGSG